MVDCDKQADTECAGKTGAQWGYCRGVVKKRCANNSTNPPPPSPPNNPPKAPNPPPKAPNPPPPSSNTKCTEWVQRGSLGANADRLVHYSNCTKRLYCKDGKTYEYKVGQNPNVNACGGGSTGTPPKAPSGTPPKGSPPSSGKKCNEWVQRGSLGANADRLVHYGNCTKRLYCKDGKTHEFKVGQNPNVNACGGGDGATSDGCPKVTDGSVYCDFKFSDNSKLAGYPIKSDSWTSCQRKCWDHGDTCKGWFYNSSSKQCALSTHREKKDMKAAKGYMGGPRRDVNAGPINTDDGIPPVDTTNNTESFIDTDFENGEGWVRGWINEHKTAVIIGTLVVLLLSSMSSAGFAIIMFM